MFKLVLFSALVVAAYCAPADKPNQQGLEQSETSWNAAWANPANPNAAAWQNPAWGANSWNRWGNQADPRARWAGAGADPWNRWGNNAGAWNQPWNRAAGAWPAAGAAGANRGWNPW